MHPSKAPRPDDLPPLFYQRPWDIVDPTVTTAVLQVLNSGEVPPNLNHTFFTLISKKNQPMKVAEYHPISLCNILYKLISKIVANRD